NFFEVLGVGPILGRSFERAEGEPGGRAVVILSRRLWERRFAADPGVLGRPITLAQASYTVIGVAPAGFPLPYGDTDAWISRIMNYSGLQAEQIRHGAPASSWELRASKPMSPCVRPRRRWHCSGGAIRTSIRAFPMPIRRAALTPLP